MPSTCRLSAFPPRAKPLNSQQSTVSIHEDRKDVFFILNMRQLQGSSLQQEEIETKTRLVCMYREINVPHGTSIYRN